MGSRSRTGWSGAWETTSKENGPTCWFHQTLAKTTHNGILVRLFESIQQPLEKGIREMRRAELYAKRSVSKRLFDEHSAIVDAIADSDSELAASRMREHLLNIESILTRHI